MTSQDKRAPMASAPLRYQDDGRVDWGNMWDSFCALALDGGPPHRGLLLAAQPAVDVGAENYQSVQQELVRGIAAVSGLSAQPAEPGWLAIRCSSRAMASWLAEAIIAENVEARAEGLLLLVPVAADFRIAYEIKNVITAVAKTTHYWRDHLPSEVKGALMAQARLGQLRLWARSLLHFRMAQGPHSPA